MRDLTVQRPADAQGGKNSATEGVPCPRCGSALVLRTTRRERNRGSRFYGCSSYPRCRFTQPCIDSVGELIPSYLATRQMVGPLLHECYAALEQVVTSAGGLHEVAVYVRQYDLTGLPRSARSHNSPAARAHRYFAPNTATGFSAV